MNSTIHKGCASYMNRSLFIPVSENYYDWKQFPIKFSLHHFLNHKKIKHRPHEITRANEISKSFDLVDAKTKILKAEKNQYGFPSKTPRKPQSKIVESLKRRVHTEAIDKIPELFIEKQPIRCITQCDRKKSNVRYSICQMRVIKKQRKSEKSMSPISKSIVLINPEQEKTTHMMTQFIQDSETLDISKLGIKSRKNVKYLKQQNRKVKTQSVSKRSYRSDEKIKGWDVRQKDYEEIAHIDAK